MKTKTSETKQDARNCRSVGKCGVCTCQQETPSHRRKQTASLRIVLTLLVVFLTSVAWASGESERSGNSRRKSGLLIIAHGSRSPQWNEPVLAQEKKVLEILGPDNPFAEVKMVFMEFAEPNVADGITELEQAGCDRIVAVPLLIAPSSHAQWDVPALLGIYSNAVIEKDLQREGARILRSRVPVTVTATLSDSDVIEQVMLKRVRRLSGDPGSEAVVLLAHGSEETPVAWDRLMKRTATYICGRTGISYADWAYVAVGQEYGRAVAAIQKAAEHRDHVIVIGAYLSLGADRIQKRWTARFDKDAGASGSGNPLEELSIRLAGQGLLPDEAVAEWIAATAKDEIRRHP